MNIQARGSPMCSKSIPLPSICRSCIVGRVGKDGEGRRRKRWLHIPVHGTRPAKTHPTKIGPKGPRVYRPALPAIHMCHHRSTITITSIVAETPKQS
jgi:hypothetical protein